MRVTHCAWCTRPIVDKRRDAIFCRKACRQASWRARVAHCALQRIEQPLRLAYADPPYPGKSDLYRDQPTYAGEVSIPDLLSRLAAYDGWALSTSAAGAPAVLAECVSRRLTVRLAVWVKTPRPHKEARILNAFEVLVFHGGRPMLSSRYPQDSSLDRQETPALRVTDVLAGVNSRIRPTLPTACIGMKPPAFCRWVFLLLGALPGDTLNDLYPGSGIVTRCWLDYTGNPSSGSAHDQTSPDHGKGDDQWTSYSASWNGSESRPASPTSCFSESNLP